MLSSSSYTCLSPRLTVTLVANSNIVADEELFAIPRSMVLQKTNSDLHLKLPEAFADLGPWDSLIIVLVYEYLRHDPSPWYPYLQLLPTTFDTLMFWTPAELSELQGSAVVNKIGKEAAEENWNSTLLPTMFNNEALFPLSTRSPNDRARELLKLAHMAGSMIMAYAFDIDGDDSDDGGEETAEGADSDLIEDDEENPAKGMVPFADMLNADAHRNNARLFHEDEFLIMKATQDIPAGDEIFNDYGPLPRSDLLRMYGYITDNYSAYDVVEVSADLIENVAASSGTDRSYLAQQVQLFGKGSLNFADKEPARGARTPWSYRQCLCHNKAQTRSKTRRHHSRGNENADYSLVPTCREVPFFEAEPTCQRIRPSAL
jgi:N-lysine methyltransferase SETD6